MTLAPGEAATLWAMETLARVRELPSSTMTVISLLYFARLDEAEVSARTGLTMLEVRRAGGAGLIELGRRLQTAAV